MGAQDWLAVANAVQRGGVATLAVLVAAGAIVGAIRGWWVPGPAYSKLEKRCDRWQQLALSALSEADKGASLAEFFREWNR